MSKSNNLTDFLTGIADAIRAKKGTTETINPQDFETEIANLSSGGSSENKLLQLVNGQLSELTAEDLAGATQIADYAFSENASLEKVVLPETCLSVGSNAFYSCLSLTEVTISNSVTTIGEFAFNNCEGLNVLTIGSSVQTIGNAAFKSIGMGVDTATITILATIPPTIQSTTFNQAMIQKIIVPSGTLATYKAATNWSKYASKLQEATA